MRELKDVADMLAKKELSRKQFLSMVGSSFVGMISGFQVLQALNTPNKGDDDDLATSNRQVFGEREYGHPGSDAINRAKKVQARFDEDVFG